MRSNLKGIDGSIQRMFFGKSEKRSSLGLPSYFSFGANKTTPVGVSAALTLPAFYNAIDQITNDIAKLPKSVYKKSDKGRDKLPNHPVSFVIGREPNNLMSAFLFWKTIAQAAILKGNGIAIIERNTNTGALIGLNFVQPHEIKNIKLIEGQVFYYLKQGVFSQSDIFHIPGFSYNGIVGRGVIEHAAMELNIGLKQQGFKSEGLDNRGIGIGVVETEKDVTPDNKKALESKIEAKVNGNAGRVSTVLLDEGFKYKNIVLTNQEQQLIEMGKISVLDICRFLNISPHKVKTVEGLNYSTLDMLNIEHASDSIMPWAIKVQQECERKLFTSSEKKDHYVKCNDNILLRADMKTKAEYYSKMLTVGALTRNEVRAYEDLNGIDGLDEPLTPVNTFTPEQIKKALEV